MTHCIFGIFYQMMLISIICHVIFSEHYFKDHIHRNKMFLGVLSCVILSSNITRMLNLHCLFAMYC